MIKNTKWYDLLSDKDKQKLMEYYDSFSMINNVVINDITISSIKCCSLYIRCDLPYPDKKVDKWEGTKYNEVSLYLKFHNIEDFTMRGIDSGEDGRVYLPIEVKLLEDGLVEVSIKNVNQEIKFKYSRLSNLSIYDIADGITDYHNI
ncbi:MAG: hypothetical protein EOP34_11300 [Rickettsiales bacterium]|nr:MAG: hypothetical protein EOP34_11300 [Rickettsiales bacterium]